MKFVYLGVNSHLVDFNVLLLLIIISFENDQIICYDDRNYFKAKIHLIYNGSTLHATQSWYANLCPFILKPTYYYLNINIYLIIKNK